MKKYINIILKKDLKKLDNKPPVIRVLRGYAFNYLIPNHIAEIATKGKVKHLKMLENSSQKKAAQIDRLNQSIYKDLEKIKLIHLRKNCGKNYQFFGRVSEYDIQQELLNRTGISIERKQIIIDEIKKIGHSICTISINETIKLNIGLRIIPSDI